MAVSVNASSQPANNVHVLFHGMVKWDITYAFMKLLLRSRSVFCTASLWIIWVLAHVLLSGCSCIHWLNSGPIVMHSMLDEKPSFPQRRSGARCQEGTGQMKSSHLVWSHSCNDVLYECHSVRMHVLEGTILTINPGIVLRWMWLYSPFPVRRIGFNPHFAYFLGCKVRIGHPGNKRISHWSMPCALHWTQSDDAQPIWELLHKAQMQGLCGTIHRWSRSILCTCRKRRNFHRHNILWVKFLRGLIFVGKSSPL